MRNKSLFMVASLLLLTACVPTQQTAAPTRIVYDREGVGVSVPASTDTIVSIGPAISEVLVAFGFADNIIAADTFSSDILGYGAQATLDMMALDVEYIISLAPDAVIISNVVRIGGEDPLAALGQAGIDVVYVPASETIAEIVADISFLADLLNREAEGAAILSQMQDYLDEVRALAQGLPPRSVYLEIGAAPHMFSLGQGTFLHELVEIAGGQNIFAEQSGWLPVADEAVIAANPDVIITNVSYLPDPISEITSRPGWENITAIQNNNVFQIDTDYSSRPSHGITRALREIAQAIHPDVFME